VFVRDPGTTIVTAADWKYERTLWQMLRSAERRALPDAHQVIAFDLGMTARGREALRSRFPWCRLTPFDFLGVPAHVRRLVSCAWKPFAIEEVLRRKGGLVLWLDSATLFHGSLEPIFDRIVADGLFTLVGQSALTRWCHPDTLRHMKVPVEDLVKPCRFGGALGFDARRRVVRDLIARWCECALQRECIDPPGASRANHRYDQSILTNLLYAFERTRGLTLTAEEVDVSSCAPVPWISTRNKVAPWLPPAADPLARLYYAAYKRLDRLILRTRRRVAAEKLALASVDPQAWRPMPLRQRTHTRSGAR
jgi:hypothetical protein